MIYRLIIVDTGTKRSSLHTCCVYYYTHRRATVYCIWVVPRILYSEENARAYSLSRVSTTITHEIGRDL